MQKSKKKKKNEIIEKKNEIILDLQKKLEETCFLYRI